MADAIKPIRDEDKDNRETWLTRTTGTLQLETLHHPEQVDAKDLVV